MQMGRGVEEADGEAGWSLVNRWYSRKWRCDICIMRDPQGKIVHGKLPAVHHGSQLLSTLACSDAWGIEQEANGQRLLAGMLTHRQFKQYLLTGMFLERSRRSGVYYLFRKLRPTVAMSAGNGDPDSPMRILACLCMHPIAYYAGSWAGAMCPADDVVAHLMMMRGDEKMFWRRSTQHPPYRPEAGL